MQFSRLFSLLVVLAIVVAAFSCTQERANVLVFSKTAGFRHESIEAGIAALEKMAADKDFDVTFTEDAADFYTANLQRYNAVVFLNTTGDVLDAEQQDAFERYIQAGGGYVGIHAATDTEYDWPWYGRLAGAYFLDHPSDPNVQTGTMVVKKQGHWATKGMPASFEKTDEFYNFRNISPDITVVLTIDESTDQGGKNGPGHPMSWYQEFDGGRAFYTAMGHTDETFSEEIFLDHLWAGIHYAAGGDNPQPLDYSRARPEENRFNKVVLAEKLDEPMELTILDDDRVLFIQRKGEVRLYKNSTQELTTIAKIPVSTVYVNEEGENSRAEDGLLGLNKDPNFTENQWIYLYYSAPEADMNVLSRFTMDGDELVMDSEKRMLEVAVQRKECCHTGGSIAWDADGNLYLSTGDNTNPHASNGYSPSDERPGRGPWDAQKSSANTNDLRGKVIRIKPQPDGSYTIPEGNLFAEGTPKTRPEIYTMGHRNPFRISIDQKTGYLYWGDVGPDANAPDSTRGPAGHDEVGQARGPGNYGWPHFVGNNKPYWKYDFATEQSLEPWDPAAPVNTSPNNTGLTELPPAQPAFIWYPYGESPEFPLVGAGGRNAMAGPVYYREDYAQAERAFPSYYDGKLFAYEWMRGWIMAVTMDEEGNYVSMERFMPSFTFNNPMDMAFAENGDLYMLEYGTGWFTENEDARLVRIEFNAGNRKPQVELLADKPGGAVPLTVNLSAEGTTDADGDELRYTWEITSANGFAETHTTPEVALNLEYAGVYEVLLTVDDGAGGVSSLTRQIVAGNAPPELQLAMAQGNRSFYTPGQAFDYVVTVSDAEDGTLDTGIDPARVAVNIDYLAEGFDQIAIAQGHRSADDGAVVAKGKTLIDGSDCQSCHKQDGESIGPSYLKIAERYAGDPGAVELLAGKIINGGSGVWGETAMSGHPQLKTSAAAEMVRYILSLTQKPEMTSLPPRGSYVAELPEGDPGQGIFVVRAAYEDNGAPGLPSLRSEETLMLRNANVGVHSYDDYEDVRKVSFGGNNMGIVEKNGSYMSLEGIDLTNVAAVVAMAVAPTGRLNTVGGTIEVHLDSPTGPLLGTSALLEPGQTPGFAPTPLNIPIALPDDFDGAFHDVYLVFKNEAATDDSLMILFGTQYVLAPAKPEAMVQ
jgi:cytochrome c